jgi:hypothetical protein
VLWITGVRYRFVIDSPARLQRILSQSHGFAILPVMAEVTARLRASLSRRKIGSAVIGHAKNNIPSNKTLVSAS